MSECIHGRRLDRCIKCGGKAVCEHKKLRAYCIECKGSQICEHKKVKHTCRECKGSQVCRHGKIQRKCVECHGKAICKHKKLRYNCLDCKGKGVCVHNKLRVICKECGGSALCEHDKQRRGCQECNPLGWAKAYLLVSKGMARRRSYLPPKITPEELLVLISISRFCVGCGGVLSWENRGPHLHHNHHTGEVLGFCHPTCNQAEGMLSNLSILERITFLKNFFPEVFKNE